MAQRRGSAVSRGAQGVCVVASGLQTPPQAVETDLVKSKPIQQASQTLVLDDFPAPKTARALSPNGRAHWARKWEAKREVSTRLACAALLREIRPVDGPVKLLFRWVFPTAGRHDLDNLIATAKPLIDALVEVGILEDDDSKHVVAVAAEVAVEKGRRALEIVIEHRPDGRA